MRGKYRNKYREKAKEVEGNKRRILNNTKIISMLFSLLLAFGIWVFITLTKSTFTRTWSRRPGRSASTT